MRSFLEEGDGAGLLVVHYSIPAKISVQIPCTVIEVTVKMDLMCCIFVYMCSPPEPSDSGAVCFGDGVATEHWPGQKLHLALLRERPTAGDISHHCLGFWTTVSFSTLTPISLPGLFVVLGCRLLGQERVPIEPC